MSTRRPLLPIALLTMSGLSNPIALQAQLLTEGGLGSIFQQFDNSSGNPADWTRSLGVGYFNTGNPGPTTPLSFLHVFNAFVPLPANGSIPNHSETFRTTVGDQQNQQWRMERGDIEIGRLYHTNPNNSFRIRVVRPATAMQPAAHLFLENSNGDGLRISANTVGAVPQPVNGFLLDRRGYVALGAAAGWAAPALSPAGPWSRLHLTHQNIGASAPNFGYRPWMRNGTMGTGNSDLFYVGHKYEMVGATGGEIDDRSDLVAAWGDDVLPAGSAHSHDNFSFRFVGALGQGGSAGTLEGLEIMRLRPFRANAEDAIEGFVGIGDWVNAGGPLPDERLDVLDRTIRIRELIPVYEDPTLDAVVVSDADGRLHWRDASTLSGQDCDWVITPDNHVVTAHLATAPDNCPDVSNNVGIGVPVPQAKLSVFKSVNSSPLPGTEIGVHVEMGTNDELVVAVDAYAESGTAANFGVQGTANRGQRNYGVRGLAGTANALNVGVYGFAGNTITGCPQNIGIWGVAPVDNPVCGNYLAGRFDGNVDVNGIGFIPGGVWTGSDEGLKTDINDITNGSEVIAQLSPKEYQFVPEAVPQLYLPPGQQAGLMAQELEVVLPHLVQRKYIPAQYDDEGEEVHPSAEIGTINYPGLIPYLIAAIKEQQTRLDQLQEALEGCCTDQPDDERAAGPVVLVRGASERLLDIIPNPVGDMARINFTLERGGHVRILLTGGEGKAVQVLHEATMQDGAYGIDWYTAQLAAGMYYITLLLDGEPMVKRAVKL